MRRRGRSGKKRKLRCGSNRMLETEVLTTLMRRTLTYPSIVESKLLEGNDTPLPNLCSACQAFCDFSNSAFNRWFETVLVSCRRGEKLSTGIIINVFCSIAHVFDANFLVIAFQSTIPALTHTKQPLKRTRCTPIPALLL